MTLRVAVVIGLWAGALFGLLEGVTLAVMRLYPAVRAPYKTSIHVLWLAPVLEMVVFAAIAASLTLLPVVRGRITAPLLTAGGVFLGMFFVLTSPELLYTSACILLAAGIAHLCYEKAALTGDRLLPALARQTRWLARAAAVLMLGCLGHDWISERWSIPAPPTGAKPGNVLVVLLDTVRFDHFERLRSEGRLPNFQRFAAQGIHFSNAWSVSSWSLPSQASILTGELPAVHGSDWPGLDMNPATPTLAAHAAKLGYVTGAFSGNASWITPEYVGRGFHRFQVYQWEDLIRRIGAGRPIARLFWALGFHEAGRGRTAAEIDRDLLEFLDSYPTHPFLAYLCYMDVNRAQYRARLNHPFWIAAPPLPVVIEAYDRALVSLDASFGSLVDQLRVRGLLERTLIVITSDHGESFGVNHPPDHNPPRHGTSLYPEQTRVPLILWAPSTLAGAQATSGAVGIHSIAPTIARVLAWPDAPFSAQSLLEPPRAPVSMSLHYGDSNHVAAAFESWQWIKRVGEGDELFDLASDPAARNNLWGRRPAPAQIQAVMAEGAQK